MPLKKGQVINPAGRPKGAKNKNPNYVKWFLKDLAEKNTDNVTLALESVRQIDPDRFVELYLKLCAYVVPKMTSTSISMDTEIPINIILPKSKLKELPKEDTKLIDISEE